MKYLTTKTLRSFVTVIKAGQSLRSTNIHIIPQFACFPTSNDVGMFPPVKRVLTPLTTLLLFKPSLIHPVTRFMLQPRLSELVTVPSLISIQQLLERARWRLKLCLLAARYCSHAALLIMEIY